jgi:hypothetical protein
MNKALPALFPRKVSAVPVGLTYMTNGLVVLMMLRVSALYNHSKV